MASDDVWNESKSCEKAALVEEWAMQRRNRVVDKRRGFFQHFRRHYVNGSDRFFNPVRRGISVTPTVAESPGENSFRRVSSGGEG